MDEVPRACLPGSLAVSSPWLLRGVAVWHDRVLRQDGPLTLTKKEET